MPEYEIQINSARQASESKQPLSLPGGTESFRLARVARTDYSKNRVFIKFFGTDMYAPDKQVEAIYTGWMGASDGTGIWHGLSKGDTVLVTNTKSDRFIILTKLTNISSNSLDLTSVLDDTLTSTNENFIDGTFAIRTRLTKGTAPSELMTIEAVPGRGILIGAKPFSSLFFDYFPSTTNSSKYDSVYNLSTGQAYHITEAGYSIDGIILRTTTQPSNQLPDVRNQERWYANLQPVCFDPSRNRIDKTEDSNRIKNPPFIEKREIVYEFAESACIESDNDEEKKHVPESASTANTKYMNRISTNRRARKFDTLSLSLISPNHLIESTKGTLVDVYGNVLDLNRNKLPIGTNETIKLDGTVESYKLLREQHRRGIAFHWELNARKDLKEAPIETGKEDQYAYIKNTYTRERHRLFFDVDKEGQFKLHIPSSSEKGNIGLIANYENLSTINPVRDGDGDNYNTFVMPKEGQQDILLDSFGQGCVTLVGSEKLIPKDRITKQPIKLGTVFHDISKTCCEPVFIDPEDKDLGAAIFAGPDGGPDGKIWTSVVSTEINIDGDKANAGGRSGTITSDGMFSFSIGANTIDRQSIWLDTEGGIISRIGRDKNDMSICTQLDGHYFMQIGGVTVDNDKRYDCINDANKNFTFEIRLIDANNNYHRINIDKHGILLKSSADIRLETKDNIVLHAAKIISNCEIEEKYTAQYDLDTWKRPKMWGVIPRMLAETDVYHAIDDGTGAA